MHHRLEGHLGPDGHCFLLALCYWDSMNMYTCNYKTHVKFACIISFPQHLALPMVLHSTHLFYKEIVMDHERLQKCMYLGQGKLSGVLRDGGGRKWKMLRMNVETIA